MRILFAFVFVAACSSDKSGTDAGTSKDAAPTDGTMASDVSSDTGGGDACTATWSSCQNCIANGCSSELVACTMDAPCKSALTALASCVNSCGASCKQTFQQSSGTQGAMLATCMTSGCAKDCP